MSDLWPLESNPLARAWDEARRAVLAAGTEGYVDPLLRLHDPAFTGPPWDYEFSHVGDLPTSLHEKQEDARTCGARHRFLFWANQSGKSSFAATDWAEIALGRHPVYSRWANFTPPVSLWASSLTWDLWQTVQLPELLSWIPQDRILDAPEPFRQSTKRIIRIRADNGKVSTIEGKSAEQGRAKYQARRVHGIWFDEEHPLSIWHEALMRLVRFGGITLTSATPLKGFTWLYHDIYEPWKKGQSDPKQFFCSHAGMADNPGIPPEMVEQARENLKHNKAQLEARLYGRFAAPEGLALRVTEEHFEILTDEECRRLVSLGQPFAGIDFGAWRFGFVLRAVDEDGRIHQVDELFSQQETLEARARKIAAMCAHYGCPPNLKIRGDAANPTDIMEINAAFQRLGEPYRVHAVTSENKARVTSVERINDLLGRGALFYRRGVMEDQTWMLGMNASASGTPVSGSRLLWEVNNWCYPAPGEGKAQAQDPDDHTADGADLIAADRYAIMSHLRPGREKETDDRPPAQVYDRKGDDLMKELSKRYGGQKKGRWRKAS